ncbi:MAG: hypothetical protein WCK49_05635 [Myxococcaceae bacterium]
MVERTSRTPDSLQGLSDGDSTPRRTDSRDSFEHLDFAGEAFEQYSNGDLDKKIELTNKIFEMKRSGQPEDLASANQFNKSFTSENAYLRENASKLTQSYDPKDPTLTPFVKTILDGHPFMAKRMFDLVVKEKGEAAVPELARQLVNRWNDTTSGMKEADRETITKIVDGCLPELSKPFRDLFYAKPKKA